MIKKREEAALEEEEFGAGGSPSKSSMTG